MKRQADEGEDDEEGAVEVAVLQVLLDAAVMAPCVDKGGHLEEESEVWPLLSFNFTVPVADDVEPCGSGTGGYGQGWLQTAGRTVRDL